MHRNNSPAKNNQCVWAVQSLCISEILISWNKPCSDQQREIIWIILTYSVFIGKRFNPETMSVPSKNKPQNIALGQSSTYEI
jgi:hypothetical protein